MNTIATAADVRPVFQAIAEGVAANAEVAFGLMGEDTADLVTDLDRAGVRYFAARHENVALNMADGYAALNGFGVCVLSRGPGITNAATALGTAARRRSPVLILSGEAPCGFAAAGGSGAMKRVDHVALCAMLGVEYRTVLDPQELESAFADAVELARSGRVTLFAVPVDVLTASTSHRLGAVAAAARSLASAADPEPDGLAAALAALAAARRPFILAGRGAALAGAGAALEALADRTGALLGTTMQAKDLFRGSPLDVGVVGGFSSPRTRELLEEVDCALVFGARLSDFTTAHGRIFGAVPVVQFDSDPAPATPSVSVSLQLVADAGAAARALGDALPARDADDVPPLHAPDVLERVASSHRYHEDDLSREDAIDPRILAAELDAILPGERTILTDGGHCMGFPAMHMRVSDPTRYLLYEGIGSMGTGLGTAMGTAIARPQSPMVLCIGDGALTMTLGDLETAIRHQIPILIVVFNDGSYAAERHFLDLAGRPNEQSIFGDVDFAAVARGLGIPAATVRTVADLHAHAPLLREPPAGPFLLDCKTVGSVRSRWIEEL